MLAKAPQSFETPRLLLRKPLFGDAHGIFRRYAGDANVTRFLCWTTHRTVADTYAFLRWSDAEWERWPAGPYLLFCREGKNLRVLGSTGIAFKEQDTAEAGYALAQSAWGHGYATEALRAIVEIARLVGLESLRAACHAEHAASQRVLEKCGFQCQGTASERMLFPNLLGGLRADVLNYFIQIEQLPSETYFSTSTPRQKAT
jgi:ribosomal-protein-alanine N-acetyltransferase